MLRIPRVDSPRRMEEENEARVSPGDESRVSFVRKRENSHFNFPPILFTNAANEKTKVPAFPKTL